MTVAPMAMATIRSVPPRISQRIGPPREAEAILNDVVPRNELPEAEFSQLPAHGFDIAPRWN
jgi:hypothetical protein